MLAVNGLSCFLGHILDGCVNEIIKQRPEPLLPVTGLLLWEGCRCCCAHNDRPATLCSSTPQGAVVDTCTGAQPTSSFQNGVLAERDFAACTSSSPAPCQQLARCCSSILSCQHLGRSSGACGLRQIAGAARIRALFRCSRADAANGRGFVERAAKSAQQHINTLKHRP